MQAFVSEWRLQGGNIMSIVQMLFQANGRIRRRDYWLWSIVFGLVVVALEIGGHYVLAPAGNLVADLSGWATFVPTPYNILMWCVLLAGQYVGICISAKRWHDRNKSGYMAGAVSVIYLVTTALQIYFGPLQLHYNMAISGLASFVGMAIGIWLLVELGCLDGTQGPNRYGPSPKGVNAAPDVF